MMSLGIDDLKKLLADKKLPAGKSAKKEDMIESLFAHEARIRKELEAYEVKIGEVLTKKREELEGYTASELKLQCEAKGLKRGVAKEERIQVLLEAAKTDGEVEKTIAALARDARRQELLAKDKQELRALCEEAGVDPFVKAVVIERLMSHECEHGPIVVDSKPAKKAKTSK